MRLYYILFFLLILSVGIYLNRSYAYFFHFIGQENLPNPDIQTKYVLGEENPKKTVYVALGDSLTAGVGSSKMEDTYPYLVAQNLAKKYPQVSLFDFGNPGVKVQDVISYQIPRSVDLYPEFVTVLIGINDVLGERTLSQFTKDYGQMLENLNQFKNSKIYILNIPYLGSPKTTFFPYNFLLNFRIRQFNQVIATLAKKYPFYYIDLYTLTKQDEKSSDYYSSDGFHPSDSGYKKWGEIINANISQ